MSAEADTLVFVYGENPAIGELDTTDEDLVIVTRDAAEKISAAYSCRTWGDYADLCGQSWAGLPTGPWRSCPGRCGKIRGLRT